MSKTYLPKIFIASSLEKQKLVLTLEKELKKYANITKWFKDFFKSGDITLLKLLDAANTFDYAIILVSQDDQLKSRNITFGSPRDNVIFEAGLFLAVLGPKRVFILLESKKGIKTKKPSDLDGFNYISYKIESTYLKSMNNALEQIKSTIKKQTNNSRLRAIRDKIHKYKLKLEELIEKELDFELPLIDWRLEQELGKLTQINTNSWQIFAKDSIPYLRYVFEHVLKSLHPGDSYITLSNLEFWSPQKFGVGDFISANVNAIRKSSIVIDRVILVNAKLISKKCPNELKNEKLNLIQLVKLFHGNPILSKSNLLFFLTNNPDSKDYQHVPFVIIKRGEKDKVKYMSLVAQFPLKRDPYLLIRFHNKIDLLIESHLDLFTRHKRNKDNKSECISLREIRKRLEI